MSQLDELGLDLPVELLPGQSLVGVLLEQDPFLEVVQQLRGVHVRLYRFVRLGLQRLEVQLQVTATVAQHGGKLVSVDTLHYLLPETVDQHLKLLQLPVDSHPKLAIPRIDLLIGLVHLLFEACTDFGQLLLTGPHNEVPHNHRIAVHVTLKHFRA